MAKRLVVTSGEPSSVGPDIVLELAKQSWPHELVICGNKALLMDRAKQLKYCCDFIDYKPNLPVTPSKKGVLTIADIKLNCPVKPGVLNKQNSQSVVASLNFASQKCLSGEFAGLVTAPVHKGIINDAGLTFTGHTEFFAERAERDIVVMMLATPGLKVALVTTHLPLRDVADAITQDRLRDIITVLNEELALKYAIKSPEIYVCGLNPHAGENGHLGREEIETIIPVIEQLSKQGINLTGPLPADSIFQDSYLTKADVILAMYHDQGLPVLKYKGFGNAINITLGLPYVRTSVDHGTALELAGSGEARSGSLFCAVNEAIKMMEKQA